MRIKRTIIIPALLALSAAVGSAMPVAVAAAPSAHVLLTASAKPDTYFHG